MDLPMVFQLDGASIRDAMLAIQNGSASAAIAIERNGILAGIVTDGDVRRALIQGHDLHDSVAPFIRSNPVVASEGESRAAILDLMHARGISVVPVVNSAGEVIAVHLLRELLGRMRRQNIAVIMAGGRGARLKPVTDYIPKPMVAVAGRPILERIVMHLVGFGIVEVVISVGYMADVIEDYFGNGADHGCRITYLREDPSVPLGTGGPLAAILSTGLDLSHPLLVVNGDVLSQFNVDALLEHHARSECVATIGTFVYSHEIPFGVLELDAKGDVQAIAEKPRRFERVSAGIYVLNPTLLSSIPRGRFTPMTEVLTNWIAGGKRVSTWTVEEDWLDVGRPQDLARARGIRG